MFNTGIMPVLMNKIETLGKFSGELKDKAEPYEHSFKTSQYHLKLVHLIRLKMIKFTVIYYISSKVATS